MQVLIIVSAAGWMYGCGVQGTPHPPRLERPARITDLTAVQIGQGLQMTFTLPQLTADGGRLVKPLEIELLRAMVPAGGGLAKLPEPEVWIHLGSNEWRPYAVNNAVSYSAHLSAREFHDWRGQALAVAVRTLTRGFRHRPLASDASNFVDVPILDVSEAPQDIQCKVTERALEVQFSPPAKTLSGAPLHDLAGYRIYRNSTGRAQGFELRGETQTSPFRDLEFQFGQTYYYQVQAVFGGPGHLALSEPSATVKVIPRDVFPPAAPQGLSSIFAAGGVELVWTANTEPDLAGYNVYRVHDHTAQRLNKELVRTSVFRDATAAPGKTLTYYVTAVDFSGNESKPSKYEKVDTK